MKSIISRRFLVDGMRRTRWIRIFQLVLLVAFGIMSFRQVAPFGTSYWQKTMYNEYFYQEVFDSYILFARVLCILAVLFTELILGKYHRRRIIADTIDTLPVTKKARYVTLACVSGINMMAVIVSTLLCEGIMLRVVKGLEKKNTISLFGPRQVFAGRTILARRILMTNLTIAVMGLAFIAFIGLCREMSHSRAMFLFWTVAISAVIMEAAPILSFLMELDSNLLEVAAADNFLGGRFHIWKRILDQPDPVMLFVWLVIAPLMFLLGLWFSKRSAFEYLENEKTNRWMFRMLLIVVTSLTIVFAGTFVLMSEFNAFLGILAVTALAVLMYMLVCLLYRQRLFGGNLRYFLYGILITACFVGLVMPIERHYSDLPKRESIRFVGMDGYVSTDMIFNLSERLLENTVVEQEAIDFIYNRVLQEKRKEIIQADASGMPEYCYLSLYTDSAVRIFRIRLTPGEVEMLAESASRFNATLGDDPRLMPTSDLLTEEELAVFMKLLEHDGGRETIVFERRFFGGVKRTEKHFYEFIVQKEDVSIPAIYDRFGEVYIVGAKRKSGGCADYILAISEERTGERMKEVIRSMLKAEKADLQDTYFAIMTRPVDDVSISLRLNSKFAEPQVSFSDMRGEEAVSFTQSGPIGVELMELICQYCDGTSDVENEVVFRIYYTRQKDGTVEEWHVTVPNEEIEAWFQKAKEVNQREEAAK